MVTWVSTARGATAREDGLDPLRSTKIASKLMTLRLETPSVGVYNNFTSTPPAESGVGAHTAADD